MRATVETTTNPQVIIFSGARPTIQNTPNYERTEEEDKRYNLKKIRKELQEDSTLVNTTLDEIAEYIQLGKIKVVSDGSYIEKHKAGTSASIIAIDEHKYLIVRHMTSGEALVQGSPRSELSGIMGSILVIQEICTLYNIGANKVELRCDGLGQIRIMNKMHPSTNNSRRHFDLIEAIRRILKESNTIWTFKHVKGHQDRLAKNQDLDIWAKLNIIADEEAKKKVTQICNYPQLLKNRPTLLPNEKCRIYITTERGHTRTKISSQLVKTGEKAIH